MVVSISRAQAIQFIYIQAGYMDYLDVALRRG
jgi:hypothetical protein